MSHSTMIHCCLLTRNAVCHPTAFQRRNAAWQHCLSCSFVRSGCLDSFFTGPPWCCQLRLSWDLWCNCTAPIKKKTKKPLRSVKTEDIILLKFPQPFFSLTIRKCNHRVSWFIAFCPSKVYHWLLPPWYIWGNNIFGIMICSECESCILLQETKGFVRPREAVRLLLFSLCKAPVDLT